MGFFVGFFVGVGLEGLIPKIQSMKSNIQKGVSFRLRSFVRLACSTSAWF